MIIRGHRKNLGKMVTCVSLMPLGGMVQIGGFDGRLPSDTPTWLIDPPVTWTLSLLGAETEVSAPYYADVSLIPIRPDDAEHDDAMSAGADYEVSA